MKRFAGAWHVGKNIFGLGDTCLSPGLLPEQVRAREVLGLVVIFSGRRTKTDAGCGEFQKSPPLPPAL